LNLGAKNSGNWYNPNVSEKEVFMAMQRLQKIMAAAGVDSRRNCEELIISGAVAVNGKIVETLPAFADPDEDTITVNGRKITAVRKVYYLLNKPRGVLCTDFDPQGRPTAIDIVGARGRIFCIGRLDADTTGLIILTNDTEMANRLTHPRYGVAKTYVAEVEGMVGSEQVEKIKKGVWLAEGKTGPAIVKILNRGHKGTLLEIIIKQGINRQVRRMLLKVGLKVKSLKQTQIGRIDCRGVGAGRFRPLKADEVAYLKKITAYSSSSKLPKPIGE
jgi:23S rRNA pseudouridine2605 synthase